MVDVEVEFEYTAEQPDELTIKKGETIKNVLMVEGGWWEGELNGKKGMFPDNFVKVIKDKEVKKEEVKKEEVKKEEVKVQASKRQSVKDLANKIKAHVPDGPGPTRRKDSSGKKKRAKVLFLYEPENDDELKLDVGDIVEVIKQEEEGWWEGMLNGKTGVFPSNFVEVIEEDESVVAETAESEEASSKLIKGKKVKGVGLGNIFGDGPIKLRHTDGPAPVKGKRPSEKVQERKAPEQPVQRKSKEEKESAPLPPVEKALVRFSYAAENEDELTLEEGQQITVLDKDLEDGGWWKGEIGGKIGVFPDNFVELVKEEPKPKKPPPPTAAPAPKQAPKLPDKAPVADQKPEIKEEKPVNQAPSIPTKKPVHASHPPPPIGKKPHKPAEPPKPADTSHTTKTTEEEKHKPPEAVSTSGSFEAVEAQGEKLVHLTASRPKGPSKRPPSQVFFQNPKTANIQEEERNGDVKDSHWAKEEKRVPSHPPPFTEKKEEPKEKHVSAPARPPDPSPAVSTAATASLHSAIEELRRELHDLKQNTVSMAAFNELKTENEHLRKDVDNLKHTYSRRINDVMSEVDEEKKLRLVTQVEVERIRKLVAESHV